MQYLHLDSMPVLLLAQASAVGVSVYINILSGLVAFVTFAIVGFIALGKTRSEQLKGYKETAEQRTGERDEARLDAEYWKRRFMEKDALLDQALRGKNVSDDK